VSKTKQQYSSRQERHALGKAITQTGEDSLPFQINETHGHERYEKDVGVFVIIEREVY
jgi:hypothetical protein